MAFRFGDSSDDLGDMAEINVTPLVDVMLVLLIIFMSTAPTLTSGRKTSSFRSGRCCADAESNARSSKPTRECRTDV